ncbi:hypothetical protein [Bradyrhizobium sp. USDA 4529]
MYDQVDAVGRGPMSGFCLGRAESLLDPRQPAVEFFLWPGIQSRKCADDSGAALRDHEIDPRC